MKRAIVAVLLLLAVAFIFVEARPSRQFFNCLRNCGKNNSKMKCLSQCKVHTHTDIYLNHIYSSFDLNVCVFFRFIYENQSPDFAELRRSPPWKLPDRDLWLWMSIYPTRICSMC